MHDEELGVFARVGEGRHYKPDGASRSVLYRSYWTIRYSHIEAILGQATTLKNGWLRFNAMLVLASDRQRYPNYKIRTLIDESSLDFYATW